MNRLVLFLLFTIASLALFANDGITAEDYISIIKSDFFDAKVLNTLNKYNLTQYQTGYDFEYQFGHSTDVYYLHNIKVKGGQYYVLDQEQLAYSLEFELDKQTGMILRTWLKTWNGKSTIDTRTLSNYNFEYSGKDINGRLLFCSRDMDMPCSIILETNKTPNVIFAENRNTYTGRAQALKAGFRSPVDFRFLNGLIFEGDIYSAQKLIQGVNGYRLIKHDKHYGKTINGELAQMTFEINKGNAHEEYYDRIVVNYYKASGKIFCIETPIAPLTKKHYINGLLGIGYKNIDINEPVWSKFLDGKGIKAVLEPDSRNVDWLFLYNIDDEDPLNDVQLYKTYSGSPENTSQNEVPATTARPMFPQYDGRTVEEWIESKQVEQLKKDALIAPFKSDVKPRFNGSLLSWLAQNVKYPVDAQEKNAEGRVVVLILVNEDGSVSNAHVINSIYPSLDREALRVCKAMPNWIPGKNGGNPIKVWMSIPVSFRLQ